MSDIDTVLHQHGLQRDKEDPTLVTWLEESDLHPRRWPLTRRLFDSIVIISIQFLTTAQSTSATAFALASREEYGLTRTVALVAFVLTYQIGRGCGSITLPPWTETFGRKKTYIISTFIYAVFSLIAGVVPSVAGAVVGRYFSGVVSAVGGSVAVGSLQDMYGTQARVWAVWIWTAAATAALAIGPVYGAYITAALGWRWGFYIVAIAAAFLTVCCCFLRESRASCILRQQLKKVHQQTGTSDLHCEGGKAPGPKELITSTLIRPLYFFLTEPIVATVVSLSAIAWSLMFLFTESFTVVFGLDGFSETKSSLFFIAILIGVPFSGLIRLRDQQVLRSKAGGGQKTQPEDKLLGFALGAPALAVGLWWFAWTTPQAVHTAWIAPALALVVVGFAITELEYVLAGYLADSYGAYASSAVGSVSTIRAALAGALPLFAYFMFTGIQTNAASSILAAVATAYCAAPVVFMRYGRRLRERSPWAECEG